MPLEEILYDGIVDGWEVILNDPVEFFQCDRIVWVGDVEDVHQRLADQERLRLGLGLNGNRTGKRICWFNLWPYKTMSHASQLCEFWRACMRFLSVGASILCSMI